MNTKARAELYDRVHAARRQAEEQQRAQEEDRTMMRQDQLGEEESEQMQLDEEETLQGEQEAGDEHNENTNASSATVSMNEEGDDEQENDQDTEEQVSSIIAALHRGAGPDSPPESNSSIEAEQKEKMSESLSTARTHKGHYDDREEEEKASSATAPGAIRRMSMEDCSERSIDVIMAVVRERSSHEHNDANPSKKESMPVITDPVAACLTPAQLTVHAQNGALPQKPRRLQRVPSVGAHRVQPSTALSAPQEDLEAATPPTSLRRGQLLADECSPGAHGSSAFLTVETHEGSHTTFTGDPQSGEFAASVQELFASSNIQFLQATLVEEEEDDDARARIRRSSRKSRGSSVRMSLRASTSALLVHAIPLKDRVFGCWFPSFSSKTKQLFCALLCLLTILGLGLGLGLARRSSIDDSLPTLQQIQKRGVLRCGVGTYNSALHFLDENGEQAGFDATLCRAVAAAVLGDDTKVEFTTYVMKERFVGLFNNEVDLLAAGTTHTMEREVNEATTQTGFSFSTPYLYEGLQLAGDPQSVRCLEDNFKNTNECSLIKVCVIDGTSHYAVLSAKLPGRQLHVVDSHESMLEAFVNRACLVIAHEGQQLEESTVRDAGYRGGYALGNQILSREPLSLVTRNNDPQWSKFVNSVLHSLFLAEKYGISKASADAFPLSSAFGEDYKHMFQNAIASAGSYADLYEEFMEPVLPRKAVNQLNDDSSHQSGLLYSFPLGSPEMYGKAAVGGYMEQLQMQRKLKCGIVFDRPGFAELPPKGIEVDLCRALSAVLFSGFSTEFELVPVGSPEEGYNSLEEGLVDVFLGASWNFNSYTRDDPISFSPPYFYNATTEENLCLATSGRHPYWSSFVYWVVMGLIQAEENGVTMDDSNSMPSVGLFGPGYQRMFRDSILTVGSFGQMYNQSLQELYPRQGRTLLNSGVSPGPQHYAIPGLI